MLISVCGLRCCCALALDWLIYLSIISYLRRLNFFAHALNKVASSLQPNSTQITVLILITIQVKQAWIKFLLQKLFNKFSKTISRNSGLSCTLSPFLKILLLLLHALFLSYPALLQYSLYVPVLQEFIGSRTCSIGGKKR